MLLFERPNQGSRAAVIAKLITLVILIGGVAIGIALYDPPAELEGTRWERIAEATERCAVHRVGSPQYVTCRATAAETP